MAICSPVNMVFSPGRSARTRKGYGRERSDMPLFIEDFMNMSWIAVLVHCKANNKFYTMYKTSPEIKEYIEEEQADLDVSAYNPDFDVITRKVAKLTNGSMERARLVLPNFPTDEHQELVFVPYETVSDEYYEFDLSETHPRF